MGSRPRSLLCVFQESGVLIVDAVAFGVSEQLANSDSKLMPTCQMPTNLLAFVTLQSHSLELCLWLSFSLAGLGSFHSFSLDLIKEVSGIMRMPRLLDSAVNWRFE